MGTPAKGAGRGGHGSARRRFLLILSRIGRSDRDQSGPPRAGERPKVPRVDRQQRSVPSVVRAPVDGRPLQRPAGRGQSLRGGEVREVRARECSREVNVPSVDAAAPPRARVILAQRGEARSASRPSDGLAGAGTTDSWDPPSVSAVT